MAFAFDVFTGMIPGWRAATSMKTDLVLHTFEMAMFTQALQGTGDLSGLVRHQKRRQPIHLLRVHPAAARRRVYPSVGSVGDADDDALAEAQIGLFKSELIWALARVFSATELVCCRR